MHAHEGNEEKYGMTAFVRDNKDLITSFGVFGAILSLMLREIGQSIFSDLGTMSVLAIFLMLGWTLVMSTGKDSTKRSSMLQIFDYAMLCFIASMVAFTFEKYWTTMAGLLIGLVAILPSLAVFAFLLFLREKMHKRCKSFAEERVLRIMSLITFVAFVLLFMYLIATGSSIEHPLGMADLPVRVVLWGLSIFFLESSRDYYLKLKRC